MEELGCDYISSGGNSPLQHITPGPGYQTVFANAIRAEVSMRDITVGQIVSPHQAETVLRLRATDMVAIARQSLFNPRWSWHVAKELGADMIYPQTIRESPSDPVAGHYALTLILSPMGSVALR